MAKPPGSAGFPVIGDKSVEFYRDAVGFVDRKIEQLKSEIFTTRFLNQTTVFVTSNAGVKQLLDDEKSDYEMGYKQFLHGIYGDNVVFLDGEEAQYTRCVLQKILMCHQSVHHFEQTADRIASEALRNISTSAPVTVYPLLKKLCTEVCLSVFLDINFVTSSELAADIVALTTTHWHGIISVPLNFTLPIMQQKSSYGRAIDAKEKLLQIIDDKLSGCAFNGFTSVIGDGEFKKRDLAHNHVLLFTSALVPKALASILTSFILVTANRRDLVQRCRDSDETLECVLLETQRLWPPFVGGRRIAKQDSTLQGLTVTKGQAVMYMSYHAQRDGRVFNDPHEFLPDRWLNRNKHDRDKLFLFGGGSRCCLGQHLVHYLIHKVASELIQRFDWSMLEGQEVKYKWLPVARPMADVQLHFIPRDAEF